MSGKGWVFYFVEQLVKKLFFHSGFERGDPGILSTGECRTDGGGQRERLQRHGQDAAACAPCGHPNSTRGYQSLRIQQ